MLPAAYRRSSSNPSPRGAMMRRVPPRGESVTTRIDRRLRQVDHRLSSGRLGIIVVVLVVVLLSFTATTKTVEEPKTKPPELSGMKEKDLFQQFRAFAEDVAHIDVDAVERASKEDAESRYEDDVIATFRSRRAANPARPITYEVKGRQEAWARKWRTQGEIGREVRCREGRQKSCHWLEKLGPVDVGCRAYISNLGLSATRSHLPPTLSVTTSEGVTTEYSAPLPRRTELELPSLCAYAENDASQKNDGGVVGLVATSSLDYLFRQWAAVANKALVFAAANLDWYLWIGDLDKRLGTTASRDCKARIASGLNTQAHSNKGRDSLYVGNSSRLNSNHLVKVVAAYALVQKPGVAGVAYVDVDAMADRSQLLKAMTLVDYTGFSQPSGLKLSFWAHPGESTNWWQTVSSRFYVKADEDTASKLLGSWIASRCGYKDQLALWHALLKMASADDCLRGSYNGEVLTNMTYWDAKTYPTHLQIAPAKVDPLLGTCKEMRGRCPKLKLCDADTKLLDGLLTHGTVTEATSVRTFPYVDKRGKFFDLEVPDAIPSMLHNKKFEAMGAAYAKLPKRAAEGWYLKYFGLDLFDEVVRSQVIDRKAPTVEAVQVHRVDKNTTAKAAVAPRVVVAPPPPPKKKDRNAPYVDSLGREIYQATSPREDVPAPPADSEVFKALAPDAFSTELKAKRPRSFRKAPSDAGGSYGRAQRNQHNQASRAAARERASKIFVERSVAAAPNPVTADEVAAMKKELEQAGADLVVPRANEEEGFQIAVEKA